MLFLEEQTLLFKGKDIQYQSDYGGIVSVTLRHTIAVNDRYYVPPRVRIVL